MSQEKKKSGLATAGMVLGIIAIPGCWIPFLNVVSIILGILAFIFGIIPLVKKQSTGKAITAVVLGIISIAIGFYMTSAATKSIDDALNSDSSVVSSDNKDKDEKTVYKVGDSIKFDDKIVTVNKVTRNWNSNNEFIKPDSGNEFVKIKVTIKNNSKDRISYNTFDWKMQNSDGAIKDVDMNSFGDGSLDSGELAADGKVSGFIVFQVPSGDKGLILHYEPSFWSDKKLEIKL